MSRLYLKPLLSPEAFPEVDEFDEEASKIVEDIGRSLETSN